MTKISPIGRVSYPHVFKVNEFEGKRSFSVTLLFDSSADLSELKAMAAEAVKEKWPDGAPEDLRSPFQSGDKKNRNGDHPEYAGMTYITFKTSESRKPQVVDARKNPITEESGEFYAGCYARVSFGYYAYDKAGNKGVNFGLNNVQKVRDGDRLDGGSNADADFEALESDDAADLF
jgi:hypothetical protein